MDLPRDSDQLLVHGLPPLSAREPSGPFSESSFGYLSLYLSTVDLCAQSSFARLARSAQMWVLERSSLVSYLSPALFNAHGYYPSRRNVEGMRREWSATAPAVRMSRKTWVALETCANRETRFGNERDASTCGRRLRNRARSRKVCPKGM